MTVKENWKPVTIGGLTGILMGAGAMYGVQAMASGVHDDSTSADVEGIRAATVDDGMTFREAFSAARAQLGPGGVFTWHGNIYNTYTAAEWKAMSHVEKDLFIAHVKPEIPAYEVEMRLVSESVTIDDDVRVAYTDQTHTTSWNELGQDDNDVRVVGFKDIEIGRGNSIYMQQLDINRQRVAVIDIDKDGDPDLAMTDLNHNHQMDEGEVIDLHTGEAITFANDDCVADTNVDFDSNIL